MAKKSGKHETDSPSSEPINNIDKSIHHSARSTVQSLNNSLSDDLLCNSSQFDDIPFTVVDDSATFRHDTSFQDNTTNKAKEGLKPLKLYIPVGLGKEDDHKSTRSSSILPDIFETPEEDERDKGFRMFLQRKINSQVLRCHWCRFSHFFVHYYIVYKSMLHELCLIFSS